MNNMNLKTFLNILRKEGLLNANRMEDIVGEDDDALENRIKIQKFVYLAKYFGIDLGYSDYNIYMYGPYSPTLAEEYYTLAEEGFFNTPLDSIVIDEADRSIHEFIKYIKEGRSSAEWLETASTALAFAKTGEHSSLDTLTEHVAYVKWKFDKEFVRAVIEDLYNNKLLHL